MAQDFENRLTKIVSATTKTAINDATGSDDAIIGIRCANILSTAITVDVYITNGGTDYYLAKDVPIPSGGSVEFIDGGAKIVVLSGDQLNAECSDANGCDFIVSRVDAISA